MTAQSVTGVGLGSADGKNMGSEHFSASTNKLIGPRAVYIQQVTLDGSGNLTITLPQFPLSTPHYAVFATEADVSGAAAAVAASIVVGFGVTTIVLKGPASKLVNVGVFKCGMSL